MGKFESYPEADSLNDSDITLYNKNSVTHKITFSRLVSLIKNKIAATGLVTSITTGVGLVSGTITSTGLIKCKLKSETPSSLSSTTISTTANRQYAVGVDKEGNLSVNVPWQENSTYQNGTAINIVNDTINVVLDDTYTSTSTVKAATANAVRKAYNNSMRTDGSNAYRHVHFPTSLTVGIIDPDNPISIGDNSICCGYKNTIGGESALASGVYTEASGVASHSEGHGTSETNYINGEYSEYNNNTHANIAATSRGAHVEGYTEYDGQSTITGIIQANGTGSHAEGCAIGGQDDGIIIASGKGAHAEGYANCTIIGGNCAIIASGDGSHAEGIGTQATENGSHAEGLNTKASNDGTHAEGYNTKANGWYSHAEGMNTTTSGDGSHTEGFYTTASGHYSHAEGSCGVASGVGSHVEGGVLEGSPRVLGLYESQDNHTKIVKTTDSSFVSGKTYYIAPYVITPQGNENPSAMGWLELQSQNTYIFSTDTTVNSSKTYYNFNVIFGSTYSQTANGYFAHAEGNYTVADGHYSHAEGQGTKANGSVSHAEGRDTQTSGECAHAEGYQTTASDFCSHAEGYMTKAEGQISHAEGNRSEATGRLSHAEGYWTTASGAFAHTGGAYVTAAYACQLAQGGSSNKFSNSNYGKGVFCVSPNTFIYHENATLTAFNGISCTNDGGVSMTLTLNKYSMYVLYWATYSDEDDSVINSGMHYIATSKDTDNPLVQDMWSNNIIDSVSAGSITISDTHKYMFHLMRIL